MRLRSSKAACYFGTALVLFMVPVIPMITDAKPTYEQQESTMNDVQIKIASYSANVEEETFTGYEEEQGMFYNKALAVTVPYMDVFGSESDTAEIVGRLYENTIVDTIDVGSTWTKISSGNCTGYVKTSTLLFNAEAEKAAEILGEDFNTGYTLAEAEEKEAAEEAARIAEEERKAAEAEAARKAAEAEAARRQAIIENTVSGTDFTYNPTMEVSDDEIWLLACVIDWESAFQPYEGKLAVANIVLNRVRSSRYPNSITGVIYQNYQFSGVSNGAGGPSYTFQQRLSNGPRNSECIEAALEALSGTNNVRNFTAFRTVASANINSFSDFMIIADHVFY